MARRRRILSSVAAPGRTVLARIPPRLILLDVRLMGSDGFSALGQIRPLDAEEALTLMTIVILTDSQVAGGITKS